MFPKQTVILLVDDSQSVRTIMKGELIKLGFTNIIEAADGREAKQLLLQHQVQLVISDWNMPVMTGIDLLKSVRADFRFANLPFILLTAEDEMENVMKAISFKVSSYIIKPVKEETLKEKLEIVWQKHFPTTN